jgi:hypothetical protein
MTDANIPGYKLEVEPGRNLVRMAFFGYWNEAVADAFGAELGKALKSMAAAGARAGDYLYLADFRESAVQSQVMVERFQGFAAGPGSMARRVAVVTASALQKKQTERMAPYDHFRSFSTVDEAMQWLLSDDK